MKLRALEQVRKFEGGVSLYNAGFLELNIRQITSKSYTLGGTLGSETYLYSQLEESAEARSRKRYMHGRQYRPLSMEEKIPFKTPKGTEFLSGVISYDSMKALARFLKEHIDLNHECQLTAFIKSCEGASGKISADVIFERLRDNNDENLNFSDIFVSTVKIKDRDRIFDKLVSNGMEYLLERREERGFSSALMVKKRNITRMGHNIPVIDYIFTYHEDQRGSMGPEEKRQVLTYNNGKIKAYDTLNDVNRGFKDYIETGECLGESLVDIIPDSLMEVFCVVKVPSKKEMENCGALEKKYAFLNNPFFAESSLKPADIPENVEVIDNPAVFREIAGRLSGKIYVPSSVPVKIKPELMPEKSDYILLLKPAA